MRSAIRTGDSSILLVNRRWGMSCCARNMNSRPMVQTRARSGVQTMMARSAPMSALTVSAKNSIDPGQSRIVNCRSRYENVAAFTSTLDWRARASSDQSPTVLPSVTLPLRPIVPGHEQHALEERGLSACIGADKRDVQRPRRIGHAISLCPEPCRRASPRGGGGGGGGMFSVPRPDCNRDYRPSGTRAAPGAAPGGAQSGAGRAGSLWWPRQAAGARVG